MSEEEMEGHVARMEEKRIEDRVMVGKPERDHLEDLGVDGRIMSKWLLQK
jgi:hypothetical protein